MWVHSADVRSPEPGARQEQMRPPAQAAGPVAALQLAAGNRAVARWMADEALDDAGAAPIRATEAPLGAVPPTGIPSAAGSLIQRQGDDEGLGFDPVAMVEDLLDDLDDGPGLGFDPAAMVEDLLDYEGADLPPDLGYGADDDLAPAEPGRDQPSPPVQLGGKRLRIPPKHTEGQPWRRSGKKGKKFTSSKSSRRVMEHAKASIESSRAMFTATHPDDFEFAVPRRHAASQAAKGPRTFHVHRGGGNGQELDLYQVAGSRGGYDALDPNRPLFSDTDTSESEVDDEERSQ